MNELLSMLPQWADLWTGNLFRATWQGAIFLAIAWAIARYCRFLSPRIICWMWRLACIKLLMALIWIGPVRLPLLPARQSVLAQTQVVGVNASDAVNASIRLPLPDREAKRPALSTSIASLLKVTVLVLWIVGVLGAVAIAAWQWRRARRIVFLSVPIEEASLRSLCRQQADALRIRKLPAIRMSRAAACPVFVGVLRPTIIFPHDILTTFSTTELALMAGHELAHWKRRDLAWNCLLLVVRSLFFFHPLVWLMARCWSDAQESACDELVLSQEIAGPAEYGRLLLTLAIRPYDNLRPSFATVGAFSSYTNLERRIVAMTHAKPLSRKYLIIAAGLLIAVSIVSLVPWQLVAQDAIPVEQSEQNDEAPKDSVELAIRQESMSNLKQIMLGMHNFALANDATFPPAFTSKDGKPLLSWRVAILPFLDHKALYERFRLDEPWDSEHNGKLLAYMPKLYLSRASNLRDGRTVYLTPRSERSAFPGEQGIKMNQITDGLPNTISLVEVDDNHAVFWTKPDDWEVDANALQAGLHGLHHGGFLGAACDGSAHFIPSNIEREQLSALVTIAGREPASWR